MLAALALAMVVALGLGLAAFALTSPAIMVPAASNGTKADGLPSPEFIFFSIFAFCYLMWATLPLSIGSNRQFEPGRLLMYPISLRKLFALDFISEVTNLQSIFAIPAIIAMGLGAGLGSGMLGLALIATIPAVVFGVALSKWLSISLGSLIRRRRTRGETALALIGVMAGLGGALVGQLAPALLRHAESFRGLRWTPPGAAAMTLTSGLREGAT
jgi:predicted permease